jgi:2-methylcitrate dehydratase PrpD
MMGTTEKVARFVVDFDFSRLPASGVEQIKISILDTLGTALVGSKSHLGTLMTDLVKEMGGSHQARLVGSGMKTSALNAALANGTFAHADDYDDNGVFGHPGVVLIPPALALGELLKLSGKKILEAYAVGFEVAARVRAGVGGVEMEGGYHGTCLMGTMGAAAESAKLMGLDVAQTRAALGIAASLASGVMRNFGTDTKAFHAGHAARNGVLAASLAKRGFTGDPDILEAPRGFVFVFGQQQADIKRITENLGKSLSIAETKLLIKAWPCGFGNQPSMTALFRLIEQYDIRPEQVSAVEVVKASNREAGGLFRHNPQRGEEGKFSMEYNLATALVDRKVDLESYTDEKLARPMIQELIKKVTVIQDPELAALPLRLQGDTSPFSVVTLRLKDGRVLSQKEGLGKELKGEEIYAKYRENARIGGIGPNKIDRTIELVKGIEDLKDVTELMDTVS